MIEAFRDNEEIFAGLFRHAEGVYGESIPIDRQANGANPPAVSPLQFIRRSVFLPFIDTVLEKLSEIFRCDFVDCIKLQFLIPSHSESMAFASIRNAVNFLLPFVDDSIDAVEVEFTRWRSYWLRYKGDSLLYYNTLTCCCLLKKYIPVRIIFGSSSSNIDNWSGYYSNI